MHSFDFGHDPHIFGPLVAKKLAKIAEIYGFCSITSRSLNQITFNLNKH